MIDPDLTDYNQQVINNNELIMAKVEPLLRELFPNLDIPYKYIYQVLLFLEDTQVNPEVLPKVIRGIHNIVIGTGKGQVIIHVQGEISNVSVRETDAEELKTKV